jgi:hypothetical protein
LSRDGIIELAIGALAWNLKRRKEPFVENDWMSTTHGTPQGRLWFVRRGDVTRGPFPTALVKRHLILGRLRQSDELSLDREVWQPVAKYPMFAPARLAEDIAVVLAREDERQGGDRRQNEPADNPHKERRSGAERRAAEAPAIIERRQRRARVVASLKPKRQSNLLPTFLALILVAGIIIAGFLFKPRSGGSTPDCSAAAAPQVNWSNCRKEETDLGGVNMQQALLRNVRLTGSNLSGANLSASDLAYADLVGVDLSNSDLSGATMKGATARKADLRSAKLIGADLSYADLSDAVVAGADFSNAIFDDAIWVDGRTCARGSVGACR